MCIRDRCIPSTSTLSFNNCENINIYNSRFYDILETYVIRFSTCNFSKVYNCYIEKYSYIGIANANSGNNCDFSHNTLIDLYKDPSYVNTYPIILNSNEEIPTASTPMGENLYATYNYISNSTVLWESIDAHGGTNIVIIGNVCNNVYDGIACFGSYVDPQKTFNINNMIIANNIINCATEGDKLANAAHGISADGTNVIIDSNLIINAGALSSDGNAAGIYSRDNNNIKITNNILKNCRDRGIFLGVSDGAYIANNIIDGVPSSSTGETFCLFLAQPPSGQVFKNTFIENNYMSGAQHFWQNPINLRDTDYNFYICYNNNKYIGSGDFVRAPQCKPDATTSTTIASIQCARVGDIIYNSTPATGQPWAWVCITAPTSNALAVFKPIATIQ